MEDRRIKEILIEKNRDFRNLFILHQELELKLEEIYEKKFKTDQELIELGKIKKKKLRLKDSMQKYIISYKKKVI